jgi:hypothetical protein
MPGPSSIIAKKISIIKISHFSGKQGLFPGMKDPIFTRIHPEGESVSSN